MKKIFKIEWDNKGITVETNFIYNLLKNSIPGSSIYGTTFKVTELKTPTNEKIMECTKDVMLGTEVPLQVWEVVKKVMKHFMETK